jgi:hypothetical protein
MCTGLWWGNLNERAFGKHERAWKEMGIKKYWRALDFVRLRI